MVSMQRNVAMWNECSTEHAKNMACTSPHFEVHDEKQVGLCWKLSLRCLHCEYQSGMYKFLVDCYLVMVRRLVYPYDPLSYTGGRQLQPYRAGLERVVRQSTVQPHLLIMEPGRKMVYDHCGKLVGTAAWANRPLSCY